MAVNISIISRVCLCCKINSATNAGKDFHEICDEVGLELQLPTLVEAFFNIKVKNDAIKYLCDDCVNRLIELYDLKEHAKEKCRDPKGFNRKEFIKSGQLGELCTNSNNTQILKIFPNDDQHIKKGEQLNVIAYGNKNLENLEIEKGKPSTFAVDYIQADNHAEHFPVEFIIDEYGESQGLSESSSNSIIEVTNLSETEYNENFEFVEDDADQDMEMKSTVNNNLLNTKEELEIIKKNVINSLLYETENAEICSLTNLGEDIESREELKKSVKGDEKSNLNTEDIETNYIDVIYYEKAMNEEENCLRKIVIGKNKTNNSNSVREMQNIVESDTVIFNSNEMETPFHCREGSNVGVDQEEISNDAISLEEEYLIEEITCSLEYDNIDLNEYLDKVLVTKFEDLQINWQTECKLCLDKYNTLADLLNHSCVNKFVHTQGHCCVIKDCNEITYSLPILARHLILQHCDLYESIPIYGNCPDCQKTFSTITDFNKHSCCRNIKRKPGSPNYCQYCEMDFQSLKRYVFHMQFHLTNHRPKVCLLCGELFNNSNDFFEHTQYQHMAGTSMACTKCDRFFKEKEVYYSHMELHEDSRYQYSCTFCPKKYTNKFGLNQHIDIYHNKKSNAFRCSHCNKEFVHKASYRNHIKCHATDVPVESFICSACGFLTNNAEFIKSHIKSDNDSPCCAALVERSTLGFGYTCENCSLDFHTINHLKKHRLSERHNEDIFLCAKCRQSFKTLRHMRNHCSNHKDCKEWQESFPITRFFVCNIGDCQEFYPIWTSLYYHKKRPHKSAENSTNNFECQFCQQLCSSKMSLAVHVARSHNNFNIKCSYCKRSFKSQKILQEHMDYYHIPLKCESCFRKFKNRRNLESHKTMVHLNVKRYFCKHCKKGYFHKSEKDIHENKVHSQVSYKCEICNFTTNYPKSLEIHMDKHNNKLKFKCTICGKSFGRKQLLKCHLKRHLNKKDYCCAKYLYGSGCVETFLTYNLLKRHIQTKHPNSSYNINMQRDEQFRKPLNKCFEVENVSYEILEPDDGNLSERSNLNETEYEKDDIELVLENDVEYDEQ